jgi:hypothetical protein
MPWEGAWTKAEKCLLKAERIVRCSRRTRRQLRWDNGHDAVRANGELIPR